MSKPNIPFKKIPSRGLPVPVHPRLLSCLQLNSNACIPPTFFSTTHDAGPCALAMCALHTSAYPVRSAAPLQPCSDDCCCRGRMGGGQQMDMSDHMPRDPQHQQMDEMPHNGWDSAPAKDDTETPM